jgi:uncharacterized repeat protein (TIGR03803 family)
MNLFHPFAFRPHPVFERFAVTTVLVLAAGFFAPVSVQAQTLPVVENAIFNFTNVLGNANGSFLTSRLIAGSDGALYGTTSVNGTFGTMLFGGTVFKINHDGSGFQVLHTFGSIPNDGGMAKSLPQLDNSLLLGADNALYGTTILGGTNGFGTLYRATQDGSAYRILHSFGSSQNDASPAAGVIQASNGALYGTTGQQPAFTGVIFRINPDGSDYTVLTNIGVSFAALLQGQDGVLYGTSDGSNMVFKINLDGSGLTALHTFNGTDGSFPIGQLIQATNGFLFGTTKSGGTGNSGTVFMINTNGDGFQVLHNFNDGEIPGDSADPEAGLVLGPGSLFYGTTSGGITSTQHGTVFKINQDGGGYEQLVTLPGAATPVAGLLRGQSQGDIGILYGTTEGGSITNNGGFIFTILVNPPLSITPVTSQMAGNQVSLFWPGWALNYVLQSTTNLASGDWVNVTNGVPVTGVQLPKPTNTSTFYRLIAPN